MTQSLTPEQIKDLAEIERMMDAEDVFYVCLNNQRIAVTDLVADQLGLTRGQTINQTIMIAILNAQLAQIEAEKKMQGLETSAARK